MKKGEKEMNYRFDSLEDLKRHIEEEGGDAPFVANPDAEPDRWCFGKTRLMAAIVGLRMAPYLVLSEEGKDGQVFELKGCEAIQHLPTLPEFVSGADWGECWDKALGLLDELVPGMPCSTFDVEQLRKMLTEV